MEEEVFLSESVQEDVLLRDIYKASKRLMGIVNEIEDEELKGEAMVAYYSASKLASAIRKEFTEKEVVTRLAKEADEECLSLRNKQAELYALLSLQTAEINRLTNQDNVSR